MLSGSLFKKNKLPQNELQAEINKTPNEAFQSFY